jgi:hypothetical protein
MIGLTRSGAGDAAGGEAEAAARLDAYLVDASERARAADGAPLALFATSLWSHPI